MALWRFEVAPLPGLPDPAGLAVSRTVRDYGIEVEAVASSRLFLIDLEADRPAADRILRELLLDPVSECGEARRADDAPPPTPADGTPFEVHLRPGVMDPAAASTAMALNDMGFRPKSVRTARRYVFTPPPGPSEARRIARLLANDCVEEVVVGAARMSPPAEPRPHTGGVRHVPIRDLAPPELQSMSRDGHLFLSLAEMQAIQAEYRRLGREPTDLELETLAQTWSEHCVHKTLKSAVIYRGDPMPSLNADATGQGPTAEEVHYDNLLKDTIARATEELIRERRGPECLSVFKDNAGIIGFDDACGVAFKVETHNHPSAIEPYGGAATGLGGCIRDVIGCGLGARPIASTDVFCVAPPDWPIEAVPKGALHPRQVLRGVVAGVRDYGNRMGIPTVNGAIHFDPRYVGNPLVFCGSVGLIPRDRIEKAARPGDAIVVIGGRTGRDGIHGATFSSAELTTTHADEFSHAVQIGNAIEEKKLLDVVMAARGGEQAEGAKRKAQGAEEEEGAASAPSAAPGLGLTAYSSRPAPLSTSPQPLATGHSSASRCLYSAITDCGAGGLSSAIGEMGAEIGAEVDLDRVPLKYAGLRYDEIWISEAQERMVLAVPQENVAAFLALAAAEDVEATVIGRFTGTRRLIVRDRGAVVGDLSMEFLHDGLPRGVRHAEWRAAAPASGAAGRAAADADNSPAALRDGLLRRLSEPTVASKEWVIRQYDHEVQGRSVVKPLVGPLHDGPGDAAVIRPRLDADRGIAIGCGLCPELSDIDPYWMTWAAIDEAIRNVIAVGGNPELTAILDNFCWGRPDDPRQMGALVRACQACYDAAKAYGVPFISGKDSLNNEFALDPADVDVVRRAAERSGGAPPADFIRAGRIAIPGTLLISALAIVDDVHRCVTMDLKPTSDAIYLVGQPTRFADMGSPGLPRFDPAVALRTHLAVARLVRAGLADAVHDVSDGGALTALAEMALAGRRGARVRGPAVWRSAVAASEPHARIGVDARLGAARLCFDPFPALYLVAIAAGRESAFREIVGEAPWMLFATCESAPIGDAAPTGLRMEAADCGIGATIPAETTIDLDELREAWQSPLRW